MFRKTNDIGILACIQSDQWIQNWWIANETTLHSISGLRFGHYKVQSQDPTLVDIRHSRINDLIRNQAPFLC